MKKVFLVFSVLFLLGCTQKTDNICGIENCHGLDITCGSNVPDVCTEIYKLGDFCREFARCGVVNDECRFIDSPEFNACKECVEKCDEMQNGTAAFYCEAECRTMFEQ